jgi:hypothetical protein
MLKTVSTISGFVSPTFSGDVTLSDGNLVIGTSGKGIDFSATPGTGTSELLSDYEEGTFTPTITAASGTYTTVDSLSGAYTKIGREVHILVQFRVVDKGTGTGAAVISGLPFTVTSFRSTGTGFNRSNANLSGLDLNAGATSGTLYLYNATDPIVANNIMVCSATYYA